MRKIKLQMQTTINGYVAGPEGTMDWMTWQWDDELKDHVAKLTDTVDTILLGRKLAQGFIPHWESVASSPDSPELEFGRLMRAMKKVVFSRTMNQLGGYNTFLETGDAISAIQMLKSLPGNDIVTYGGSMFAGFLAANNLIDEYHLFINPAAISRGLAIIDQLSENKKFQLTSVKAFPCGIVGMIYVPSEDQEDLHVKSFDTNF